MSTSGMAAEDRRRVFTMRRALEQWGGPEGQTSVGMSGVDPRRFRGVVRFLEAYAAGQDADVRERPVNVPLPVFVRRCVDDLKAMYAAVWGIAR